MLRPDPATICCNAATCCSKADRPRGRKPGRGPRALAHEDAADLDVAGLLQGGELLGEGRVGQAHAVPDELEVGPLRLGCSASTAVSRTPFGSSPPVCLAPHPSAWRWLACRWAVVPPLSGPMCHMPRAPTRLGQGVWPGPGTDVTRRGVLSWASISNEILACRAGTVGGRACLRRGRITRMSGSHGHGFPAMTASGRERGQPCGNCSRSRDPDQSSMSAAGKAGPAGSW